MRSPPLTDDKDEDQKESRSRSNSPGCSPDPAKDPVRSPPLEQNKGIGSGMAGKNYSDFIRNLASKYSSGNPDQNKPAFTLPFSPLGSLQGSFPAVSTAPNLPGALVNPGMLPPPFSILAAVGNKSQSSHGSSGSPLDVQTQALLNVMKTAQQYQQKLILERQESKNLQEEEKGVKRQADEEGQSDPLVKKVKLQGKPESVTSLCSLIAPCSHEAKLIKDWTVEDVCNFVISVELCQPYVQVNKIY